MANEKLISKEKPLRGSSPKISSGFFYPIIDTKVDRRSLESRILGRHQCRARFGRG